MERNSTLRIDKVAWLYATLQPDDPAVTESMDLPKIFAAFKSASAGIVFFLGTALILTGCSQPSTLQEIRDADEKDAELLEKIMSLDMLSIPDKRRRLVQERPRDKWP